MEDNNHPASIWRLVRKTFRTGVGALGNRGELFMVEAREERACLIQMVVLGVGGLFLAMLVVLLVTATIIFLLPPEYRLYAAGGFALLYLVGCAAAFVGLGLLLKRTPFAETLSQFRKDRELFDIFQ